MSEFDSSLQAFYNEAQELLENVELSLLKLDENSCDINQINEVFRAIHTIKGSASIFALDHIVDFSHAVESALDIQREKATDIPKELLNLLFNCQDHLLALINYEVEEYYKDVEKQALNDSLIDKLKPWFEYLDGNNTPPDIDESMQDKANALQSWQISLKLNEDCLRNGMDPTSFIKYLSTIGTIKQIKTFVTSIPNFRDFDPEALYLSFEIIFQSNKSKNEIEETFTFIEDGSDISIIDITNKQEPLEAVNANETVLNEEDIEETLSSEDTKKNKQVRIDAQKLDDLINLVGELIISRQRVSQLAMQTHNNRLIESVESLSSFSEQIRNTALSLRMVPIGASFQRFKRLVRDTAKELGKDIQLTIKGAETELDRIMVEKLSDPLTHIVRNAIDHGIEAPELRKSTNKIKTGTITMSAFHESGHIVIEVSDDGQGIDKEALQSKAINENIIAQDQQLSHHDILQLIFHPGLSTANTITNLSGRGVGMDVVKRNIEALQGKIDILSEEGKGTTFRLRLPLTLAIIDGFHVESANTHFIIPLATIIECLDLDEHNNDTQQQCINLRGDMVPFIKLKHQFKLNAGINAKGSNNSNNRVIEKLIIVQFGDRKAGIVVDELHGEVQTVVKTLGPIFQPLKGIGGSSLLGDGDIAFILDISQLIDLAINQESHLFGLR